MQALLGAAPAGSAAAAAPSQPRDPAAAELKKEQGNELMKAQKYPEAIALYTEAIELNPDVPAYYSNRCQ